MEKQELKVALIGSAPSSVTLAPYGDQSWQIWGCSPGAYGIVPKGRSNVWWELHKYEPGQQWFSPEYCQFLRDHPKVMVAEHRHEIPNGQVMPVDDLVKKYSPYFFTSSIAWMMAVAIEMGATKIGLWGVDMAATEEYEVQRAGLHYFGMIAKRKGIEVGVPLESDLFRPRFLYGVDEITHSHVKLRARRNELMQRKAAADQRAEQAKLEANFIAGAMDDLTYMHATWVDRQNWLEPPLVGVELVDEAPVVVPVPKVRKPRKAKDPAVVPEFLKKGNGADQVGVT